MLYITAYFFSSSFLSIIVHREIECHSYKFFPFTIYLFIVLLYLFIDVQVRTRLVEKMFSVLLFQQNSQCSTHCFNILIVSSLYICHLKAGNVLLILAQQENDRFSSENSDGSIIDLYRITFQTCSDIWYFCST